MYLDNFRGFYDNEIPVEDVNFLVGENSSGKTSILKLVDLMSSQEFWFSGLFRKAEVDFSFFGDIYTPVANGSQTTKIGLTLTSRENEDDLRVLFIINESEDHQTRIAGIKFNKYREDIHVWFGKSKGEITYKIVPTSAKTGRSFSNWCRAGVDTDDMTPLGKQEQEMFFAPQASPYFLISQITRKSTKHEDKDKNNTGILDFVLKEHRWIAPIRVKPQKTYDDNIYDYSSDGAHVPYILKKIMSSSRSQKSQKIITALTKFGKDSNLFDKVSVKEFGTEGNSPFSIELVMNERGRQITNVGYGVSQILPIAIEILNNGSGRFAIQQPEVHLHPKAQASFGGLIYDATFSDSVFLIETHSDFIVDRFRQHISEKPIPKKSQVLFFERKKDKNTVYSIPIQDNGQYSDKQPKSFRSFFYNEALRNLSI